MKFTETLQQEMDHVYQEILSHPMVQKLADGTLDKKIYHFFLEQDLPYLTNYAKAVSLAKDRATQPEHKASLEEIESLIRKTSSETAPTIFAGYDTENITTCITPACSTFINYLISTAVTCEFPSYMAMFTASVMTYCNMGKYIHGHSIPNNPYKTWIDYHVKKEYLQCVQKYIDIADKAAEEASLLEREKMIEHFIVTARLEWMFLDDCYRLNIKSA